MEDSNNQPDFKGLANKLVESANFFNDLGKSIKDANNTLANIINNDRAAFEEAEERSVIARDKERIRKESKWL